MMVFHFRAEGEMHEDKDEEAKRLLKMQKKIKKKYQALHMTSGVREAKSQLSASLLSHSDNSRRFAHPNPSLRSELRILAKGLAEIPPFARKYKNEGNKKIIGGEKSWRK